jgi:hypothetical protein
VTVERSLGSRELAIVLARFQDAARRLRRWSVVLNAGEGMYSRGKNAGARFQTSLGSMRETLACIEVATAFGYIIKPEPKVLDRIDKIQATLFRLVH